jgi:hypothetical protein
MPVSKAFSSEVDTGSREENAIEQMYRAPIRYNRIGKHIQRGLPPPRQPVPAAQRA